MGGAQICGYMERWCLNDPTKRAMLLSENSVGLDLKIA